MKNSLVKKNRILWILFLFCYQTNKIVFAQPYTVFDMKTVTEKYAIHSIEAQNAILNYKSQMLEDENSKKEFLPTLAFSLNLMNFNRSIVKLQRPENGNYSYVEDYSNSSSAGFTISQKIPYANGIFSVSSNLNILSEISQDRNYFSSTPYRLSYQQQLFGERKLYRWNQKTNQLKRSKIVKEYTQKLSSIQENAAMLYVDLYVKKQKMEFTQYQCITSDSLLKVAQFRYQQGNILEKEILTLELQNTNQHLSLKEENRNYNNALENLLSYIDLKEDKNYFEIQPPTEEIPFLIQYEDVLMKFQMYSPQTETWKIKDIEAEKTAYNVRKEELFNANIYLNYGTNQYGSSLVDAYRKPISQQSATIGLQIPIFNWGVGRNKVLIAKNESLQTKNELKQEKKDKDLLLKKIVDEYNFLVEIMTMSKKSYQLSQRNFDVTMFELQQQRATIDELIEIEMAMKESFMRYLNNLSNVWRQYYSIRSECLYDYIDEKPLMDIFSDQLFNNK